MLNLPFLHFPFLFLFSFPYFLSSSYSLVILSTLFSLLFSYLFYSISLSSLPKLGLRQPHIPVSSKRASMSHTSFPFPHPCSGIFPFFTRCAGTAKSSALYYVCSARGLYSRRGGFGRLSYRVLFFSV